jgi:acetyl esterase/lipase
MNKHPVLLALAATFSLVFSACNASSEARVPTSTSVLMSATPEPTKEIVTVETTTPQPARQIPDGIVYAIPEMESIIATHTDISYSTENEALKLDVYAPPGIAADARLPAVLFVHGSAPAQRNLKNHGQYVSWGKLVGASGLIAITFNWDYPDPTGIEQLIMFVRERADELQIDRDRLCVFTVSAGVSAGFTVALKDMPTYIRCVVGYYGDPSPALDVISSQETTQLPSILLAKAALDDPTLIEGTDRFVNELTTRGAQVTLLTHDNGVHAFDIRNDDDRSREIIEQTVEFIKLQLTK